MLTSPVSAGRMLIQGVGPWVFQILEDPGTVSQGDCSSWASEAVCVRRAGAEEKVVPGSRPEPLSMVFLEDSAVGWGVGRSGSLVCGSLVRYGRELAILRVGLQNITESIPGMDLGEFDSFTVRIYWNH